MTDVKVKDGHLILAPGYETPALETVAGVLNPYLLSESLGNRRFLIFDGRRFHGNRDSLWGSGHGSGLFSAELFNIPVKSCTI